MREIKISISEYLKLVNVCALKTRHAANETESFGPWEKILNLDLTVGKFCILTNYSDNSESE